MSESPILIAGFGSAGRRHFRNLTALGYSQFIFCRSDQSTLDTTEIKDYPAFRDLANALELKPGIAIIANPTALHLSTAMDAARAGCHLFIEKPLSHDLNHLAELEKLVDRHQLTTMIGCQYRFHPLLLSLQNQLQGGRIGEVVGARADYGEFLPGWHPWEDHRRSYSAREDLGGGAILTLIHPMDYLYWLFGPVENVHASIRRIPSLKMETRDDLAEITLEFRSGVVGHIHLDYLQHPPVHTLNVWGEKGRAYLDYLGGTIRWESADGTIQREDAPTGFERNGMFVDEIKHFLDCIERRTPTLTPLKDGIEVLELALKAKQDALGRKNESTH